MKGQRSASAAMSAAIVALQVGQKMPAFLCSFFFVLNVYIRSDAGCEPSLYQFIQKLFGMSQYSLCDTLSIALH